MEGGLEPAAALLVLVVGMNLLVTVLVALALADMVDTAVGTACEAEACNRHMVGSMVGTDHGSMAGAQGSSVLSCLMADLVLPAVALVCHRPPVT